ncbi:unnamed protein product [Heligmosomoides polygyrus]|uniref:Fork-head domain-containing protein n=1 Tax=Heligmosomoides polygyrus TaxID=6339 RepID=A0A3P7WPU1_HELPZ|nr:unnamed protein product [Heligmosomoides polygyrus]
MQHTIDRGASVSTSSVDDDFGPEPRGRCYTWPMQQFVYDPMPSNALHPAMLREPTVAQLLAATPSSSSSAMGTHLMPLGMTLPPGMSSGHSLLPPKKKRCRKKPSDQLAQKKPNPWGEDSYSDIIAKALESAPDGRLKLNEIYQWFSDNIPYFRERSSQEDAAGWKVGAFWSLLFRLLLVAVPIFGLFSFVFFSPRDEPRDHQPATTGHPIAPHPSPASSAGHSF